MRSSYGANKSDEVAKRQRILTLARRIADSACVEASCWCGKVVAYIRSRFSTSHVNEHST